MFAAGGMRTSEPQVQEETPQPTVLQPSVQLVLKCDHWFRPALGESPREQMSREQKSRQPFSHFVVIDTKICFEDSF